jgi:hypothetical protein
MFFVAARMMRDLGFTPEPSAHPLQDMRKLFHASVDYGLRNPPVRWVMLAAPFSSGVGIYTFYALQPYLLELWGDPKAYSIAGLAAAIVAGAQILGGYLAPFFRRLFRKRTSALILGTLTSAAALAALGLTSSFWVALLLLAVWAMVFAAEMPIRQAYLNDMIPSRPPARHGPFLRLADGEHRRRRHPARSREGRRRVQLLDVARRRCVRAARGRAVPVRQPSRARGRRRRDQPHRGRSDRSRLGPAADVDHLAADVARVLGAEERDHPGHVLRLTHPAERSLLRT